MKAPFEVTRGLAFEKSGISTVISMGIKELDIAGQAKKKGTTDDQGAKR